MIEDQDREKQKDEVIYPFACCKGKWDISWTLFLLTEL